LVEVKMPHNLTIGIFHPPIEVLETLFAPIAKMDGKTHGLYPLARPANASN
jgi:hypothetical protein